MRLIREGGQSAYAVSKDLGVSQHALRAWVRQADRDTGRRTDGLTTAEREELIRLRRRVRTLEQERQILVKAAAFFARETDRNL